LEPYWQEHTKTTFPEVWESGIIHQWLNLGVPFPKQTLECQLPNFKKKSTFKEQQFDFKYPEGPWITLDKLHMDLEDIFKGYFFDITHETDPNIEDLPSHIISTGIGRNTTFLKSFPSK